MSVGLVGNSSASFDSKGRKERKQGILYEPWLGIMVANHRRSYTNHGWERCTMVANHRSYSSTSIYHFYLPVPFYALQDDHTITNNLVKHGMVDRNGSITALLLLLAGQLYRTATATHTDYSTIITI